MQEKIIYLILPNFRFISYIEEKGSLYFGIKKYVTCSFLFLLFSFLTFIGIKKKRISTLILLPSIMFGIFVRILERIKEPFNLEIPFFNLFSENTFLIFRNHILKFEKRILVFIFILSLFFCYALKLISFLGRILFCFYISVSTMDGGLTLEIKQKFGIFSVFFDYFVGFLVFCFLFFFTSFVIKLLMAVVFSLYGSCFLLATFEHLRGEDSLGLKGVVRVDGGSILINSRDSAFFILVFTAVLGFVIQVYVLRKK